MLSQEVSQSEVVALAKSLPHRVKPIEREEGICIDEICRLVKVGLIG
jgi:hypothetical protein